MATHRSTILFIHGMWLHATSWEAWVRYFAQSGYDAVAPGWPGEATTVLAARAHPEHVANHGIDELVTHYSGVAQALPAPPIIIGHSVGGLIAQKMLGLGIGAAAVAIDPAQIKGVLVLPLTQLRAGLPALKNPWNRSRAVSLTESEFRFGFGNALTAAESDALFDKWTIPSPARPLFEIAFANFSLHSAAQVNTHNSTRGPLLFVSGTADHTVPDVSTRSALRLYRRSGALTELKQFDGRGHSLTIDDGWQVIASDVLAWLKANGM